MAAIAWGALAFGGVYPWAFKPLATLCGAAGLLAHTIYFVAQRLTLASQAGSLLFLAWILATFYLYGSLHYRRLAWGLFVLPVIIGLIALAQVLGRNGALESAGQQTRLIDPEQFWQFAHIALFLLAAVGVSVAFLASVMYLVQSHRLKEKKFSGNGIRLLNLERLENMNRRGINWAFPLLTIGLIIGLVQMAQDGVQLQGWADPRVLSHPAGSTPARPRSGTSRSSAPLGSAAARPYRVAANGPQNRSGRPGPIHSGNE